MYLIPWVKQLVPGWAYGQIQDNDGEEITLFAGGSWKAGFCFHLWEMDEELFFFWQGGEGEMWKLLQGEAEKGKLSVIQSVGPRES